MTRKILTVALALAPVAWVAPLAVTLATTSGCDAATKATGGTISSAEARKLIAAGARLVDVRTPEEFADTHIEGAINLPLGDLSRRLAELTPKEQPIVVYCRSGNRSGRAKRALEQAGFTAVHDLGAMGNW